MRPDQNIILIAIGIIVFVFIAVLSPGKNKKRRSRIKEPTYNVSIMASKYKCAGCSKSFSHNKRTSLAAGKGINRLFCNTCHRSWLEKQPASFQANIPASNISPSKSNAVENFSYSEDLFPEVEEKAYQSKRNSNNRFGYLGIIAIFLLVTVIASVWFYA